MQWSLRVARIDGTDIKVHWSFVLVIPYFLNVTRPDGLGGLLFALAMLVLLFVCIAMHELGHSFVAGRLGIPVRNIVLWPLGGFAVLSRPPERPLHQVAIFGAGPLVNLLLAGVLFLAAREMPALLVLARRGWPASLPALLYLGTALRILANANIVLALFNLLPAYPLDGGRIARALLALLVGEPRADRIMLAVSWLLALVIGVYGALNGDWPLVLLAALVFFVAGLLSNRFTALFNRSAAYIFDRGYTYLQRGDYARAIAHYDRRLSRRPADAAAYHNRGAAHILAGDYRRGIADYDQAIALRPDSVRALLDRARALLAQQQYSQALADLDRVVRLRPGDALLYHERADAYRSGGDDQRAIADYGRVIELAPDHAEAYLERGLAYRRQGAQALASADFRRALELSDSLTVRRRAQEQLREVDGASHDRR